MKLIKEASQYRLYSDGENLHYHRKGFLLNSEINCQVKITPSVQEEIFKFVIKREVRKHVREGRYPKATLSR